jgi:hypothetical protein
MEMAASVGDQPEQGEPVPSRKGGLFAPVRTIEELSGIT